MFTSQERRFFDGLTSAVAGFVGTVLKAVTDVAERALNAVGDGLQGIGEGFAYPLITLFGSGLNAERQKGPSEYSASELNDAINNGTIGAALRADTADGSYFHDLHDHLVAGGHTRRGATEVVRDAQILELTSSGTDIHQIGSIGPRFFETGIQEPGTEV